MLSSQLSLNTQQGKTMSEENKTRANTIFRKAHFKGSGKGCASCFKKIIDTEEIDVFVSSSIDTDGKLIPPTIALLCNECGKTTTKNIVDKLTNRVFIEGEHTYDTIN